MKTASQPVEDAGHNQLLEDLYGVLSELDKRELHLPAIHVATAIDLLERRDA